MPQPFPALRSLLPRACLVAAMLIAGPAEAILTCDLDGKPIDQNNGASTAGRSGLMRCRDKDTGAPQREQELRNGVFMGAVRYYKDGQVEKEFTVNERGNRDGVYREWNVAGGKRVLAREETSRNGRTVGLARAWYPSGALQRLTWYGDDEHEQAVVEFTESGKPSALRCAAQPVFGREFDDRTACGHDGRASIVTLYGGKDVARTRVTFERGERRRSETLWENGTPREVRETTAAGGVEQSFSADGTKRHEVRFVTVASSTGGQPRSFNVLDQEFHESGKLVRERRWQPGERGADPVSDTTWYLNGQMKEQVRYVADGERQVRRETAFHDNGKPAFEGTWVVDGTRRGRGELPTGTHRDFDEQGRLSSESIYDDRGRLTRERVFDARGTVVKDDEVFEDGSRKSVGR